MRRQRSILYNCDDEAQEDHYEHNADAATANVVMTAWTQVRKS